MRKIILLPLLILSFFILNGQSKAKSNYLTNTYKTWAKGELEIHQISTNWGESAFFIFPDGTTMLIDLGAVNSTRTFPPLPDKNRSAGQTVASYIKDMNNKKEFVDYMLVTHFHADHIGDVKKSVGKTAGRGDNYELVGVTEVGEYIKFNKIIDRAWPGYDFPQKADEANVSLFNYVKYLNWMIKSQKMQVERFVVGSNTQIKELYDKSETDFSVQNIVSNGQVWTGKNLEFTDYVAANPKNLEGRLNENTMCSGILVQYGKFRYFHGGDLCSNLLAQDGSKINIEEVTGKIVGEVDVCKSNHHGFTDAMNIAFLKYVNASNYIMPVQDTVHLSPKVVPIIDRIIANSTDPNVKIIPTYMSPDQKKRYANMPFMTHVPEFLGHIIIKVLPGGGSYKIYIVENEDESRKVKTVLGPFKSKGK